MIALEPRERPALQRLIGGMETRLSHRQRQEIARMGRRAKAARAKWLRRLASNAVAEAKRLANGEGWTR
jgi:hypothetical protein